MQPAALPATRQPAMGTDPNNQIPRYGPASRFLQPPSSGSRPVTSRTPPAPPRRPGSARSLTCPAGRHRPGSYQGKQEALVTHAPHTGQNPKPPLDTAPLLQG